jgi:hypothetical protein
LRLGAATLAPSNPTPARKTLSRCFLPPSRAEEAGVKDLVVAFAMPRHRLNSTPCPCQPKPTNATLHLARVGDCVKSQQVDALKRYAQAIRNTLRSGPTNVEQALAPSFKNLLDDLLATVPAGTGIHTVPEYARQNIGRPDIALVRHGQLPRAFVELKAPSKHLDASRWRDAHDKRQFQRFGELPTWALSNFAAVRFYRRSEGGLEVRVVPETALDPTTSDTKADNLIAGHDPAAFLEILTQLAQAQPPSPSNAAQLAEFLAHAARLVRASVVERLGQMAIDKTVDHPLQHVREEFRNVLYAHPEAGGYRGEFDTLFSAAFAQTLAFGLLLVREATNQPVGPDSWQVMPAEHPLMKTALRVLSEPEIVKQIDLGFDILIDTINSFDPAILAQKPGKADPILYFYEDFLSTFDPDAKQRYGVYYTPVEVVRYMVGALDRALKDNLGTKGLGDDEVTILDPATGTGTFLLGIAERVRENAAAGAGPGAAWPALNKLASRMFGFELLIGPYAVAHYRLHHALAEKPSPSTPAPPPLPRLGIYLADTLHGPGPARRSGRSATWPIRSGTSATRPTASSASSASSRSSATLPIGAFRASTRAKSLDHSSTICGRI